MNLLGTRFNALLMACAGLILTAPASQAIQTAPANVSGDAPEAVALEGVAAIVNDTVISYSDVRQRAQFILFSLGVPPNEQTIRQAQLRAIESLIDENLQLQEAAEYELVIEEEEIESTLANMAARSGTSIDDFLQGLRANGLNPDTIRLQIRADMAWRRLVSGRFGSRVRISELQIDDNLERLESNMKQTQYRIAEIFLPAIGQEEMAQMVQGAYELKRQMEQSGAPFDRVAQQFSAAPTASAGGELGWVAKDQINTDLVDAVVSMDDPGLTDPIIVDNGVYLINLIEKSTPVEPKLSGFALKQLSASGSDALQAINAASANLNDCASLDEDTELPSNVSYADLGNMMDEELAADYWARFENAAVGQPLEAEMISATRAAKVYVCERVMTGNELPTREQIEDTLHNEMVEMMANRYLRDLRRDATIIRR